MDLEFRELKSDGERHGVASGCKALSTSQSALSTNPFSQNKLSSTNHKLLSLLSLGCGHVHPNISKYAYIGGGIPDYSRRSKTLAR